jgi:hypothetical protein
MTLEKNKKNKKGSPFKSNRIPTRLLLLLARSKTAYYGRGIQYFQAKTPFFKSTIINR